jgi:hypothetical protein
MYDVAFYHIKQAAPMLKLSTVTCDFEIALINSVEKSFEGAVLIGCLFHWKQAIRRKLIALKCDKVKTL